MASPDSTSPDAAPYRVLARKYRPATFEDMIGQDAMVRTLRNAFETGRIAHAFMLTGVRGIGKTTTARLLARALNYQSADHDGPSTDLTPPGEHCEAIMASAHMDVLEMDAASRTGVENMREMLDGVRYAPVSARYKVYIIDEVHMLSTGAFNALLKTLEEPPDHAKFIFATTEIRKVPVTVLSRCQRFDLRRVDTGVLKTHLAGICAAEGMGVSDAGLALIARAAEGSVRDGLSLLDQAMVQATPDEIGDGGEVDDAQVRDMLGLADRSRVLDLFEAIAAGDAPRAMGGVRDQYRDGASPDVLMRDLLDICHEVGRAKTLGENATFDADSETTARLRLLGDKVSPGQLSRLWQMLLRAHETVREAPVPVQAAEMAVLGLAQAADMPAPEIAATIIAEMRAGNFSWPQLSEKLQAAGVPAGDTVGSPDGGVAAAPGDRTRPPAHGSAMEAGADAVMPLAPASVTTPESLEDIVAALDPKRHADLIYDLERFVRVAEFTPGRIVFAKETGTPPDLAARLIRELRALTGELWVVDDTAASGTEPIGVRRKADAHAREARLRDHPAFAHPLLKDGADFIEFSDAVPMSAPGATLSAKLSEDAS